MYTLDCKTWFCSWTAACSDLIPRLLSRSWLLRRLRWHILRHAIDIADPQSIAPVAHETAQLPDTEPRFFMHPDEHGRADR